MKSRTRCSRYPTAWTSGSTAHSALAPCAAVESIQWCSAKSRPRHMGTHGLESSLLRASSATRSLGSTIWVLRHIGGCEKGVQMGRSNWRSLQGSSSSRSMVALDTNSSDEVRACLCSWSPSSRCSWNSRNNGHGVAQIAARERNASRAPNTALQPTADPLRGLSAAELGFLASPWTRGKTNDGVHGSCEKGRRLVDRLD